MPRLLGLLALLGLWGASASAQAVPPPLVLDHTLCHAVSPWVAPLEAPMPPLACTGVPQGYQHGSLWLSADLTRLPVDRNDLALVLHNSRFDHLRVGFLYADGTVLWQQIGTGRFGAHWRAGGQIVFAAPHRDAPLARLVLRFDRLTSLDFLRLRLMAGDEASLQSTLLAALVGGALTLLVLGAIYNLGLGLAVRRQFPAWQGAWAACMVAWGAFWSQLALLAAPGLAGAPSAKICTALAGLAISLATQSAVTALARSHLPRGMRGLAMALGAGVGVLSVPLSLLRSGRIEMWASVLNALVLADLLVVAVCLALAWRRGSPEARAFTGAWAVPMLALGSSNFFDIDAMLWGGGSQLLVLLAAAWQTLWLSIAATYRLTRLRRERDRARQAQNIAQEQARRDALTGLRNRRGFIELAETMLSRVEEDAGPLALLLLDVDRFKAINDTHGHEAGDRVLCTLARRLERWEGALCTVARFGGEEFAVMVAGLPERPLAQFAERMREGIAQCDHGADLGRVTVSIGVAQARTGTDFQSLYRAADTALYRAKRQGRDQVAIAGESQASPPLPDMAHTA